MAKSGIVKFFDSHKGFGFISPEDGSPDLFVHCNDVTDGMTLLDGDEVDFDQDYDDRSGKEKAANVRGGSGNPLDGGFSKGSRKGGGKGSGKGGGKGGGNGGECFNCGEYGHLSRECPGPRKGGGGGKGGGACFICQEMGHLARDCPNGDSKGGKRGKGSKGGGKSDGVCYRYQEGNCSFGDNCRFRHE
mmetsp:Transcript_72102/g.143024  ORF Transcript_72102/g.143024 Transcript_72102/m.143024 type:complete len:189 (+) Transcript_72102:75-641(+)